MAYTSILPIITTSDLRAALGFYRDLLGATVS
jgi:catechol 2,3-dioxygenase-like lactoylglutathione lyase family enzyme